MAKVTLSSANPDALLAKGHLRTGLTVAKFATSAKRGGPPCHLL